MFREPLLALLALLPLTLLGWLFDWPYGGFLLGLLGYLTWHLYNLYRLNRAVEDGGEYPESEGIWDQVFRKLERRQRRQRQRLRRFKKTIRRFEETSAALPDAVMVLDSRFNLEWCNQPGADLLGIQLPRDVGQRITNLVRSPGFASLFEHDTEGHVEFDASGVAAKVLSAHLIPYVGKRKLLVVRDISAHLAMERMLNKFVANASHELRTPLTVLRGYLETLCGNQVLAPESWKRPIEQMAGQARRMEAIIDDMLTLARLESGGARNLPKTEVAVAGLLEQIIDESRKLEPGKQLRIGTAIDPDLRVFGRESELRSAFANLILNAVQYTPEQRAIDIEWARYPDHLRFEVRDEGDGIAPEHLEHLTERFYRVDVAHSQALGGTGLGLAIVKQIASLYNGSLFIDSKPGKGSVFRVTLPLAMEVRTDDQPAVA